jgi:hypothetical protein
MNIALEEAVVLIAKWQKSQTKLRVVACYPNFRKEIHGTVKHLDGTVTHVVGNEGVLKFNLENGEFNGDLSLAGYLVCEFPNGDRYAFNTVG